MLILGPDGQPVEGDVMRRLRYQALVHLIQQRREPPAPVIAINREAGWELAARSVLIHAGAAIGDALLGTPIIRKLAQMGLSVDVVAKPRSAAVFEHSPYIRAIFVENAPDSSEYDAVIDLMGCAHYAELCRDGMVQGYAQCARLDLGGDVRLDYWPTDTELDQAQATLAGLTGPTCAYIWSAVGQARTWTPEQHGRALEALAARGVSVVLLNAEPVQIDAALNLSGRTSIREAAAIIARTDFSVAPDTGLFHVAAALDRPVLTYFGSFPLRDRRTHSRVYPVTAESTCQFAPCRTAVCAFFDDGRGSPCLDVDETAFDEALCAVLDTHGYNRLANTAA